jgi:hypothetical protein
MPVGETARNPVATGRVRSTVTAGDPKQHRAYGGAMRKLILAFALLGCENAPDPADQDIVVKDETVAHLSRQLRQQDNFDDAYRAFRLLMQAGQKGIDVIMALDSAGTMNENVWHGVRQGLWLTDEVCPHLPGFTACVQNACRRKLGISDGIGTLQVSCWDLPLIRGAFRPEELEGFAAECGADTLAVYRSLLLGQVDGLNIRLPLPSAELLVGCGILEPRPTTTRVEPDHTMPRRYR